MHTQPFGATVRGQTVRVHGDVDMGASEQLKQAILHCADDREHHTVVVDLTWVTFIDSAGILALVESHGTLAAEGKALVVQGITEATRMTFHMAGVMDYLNVRSPSA